MREDGCFKKAYWYLVKGENSLRHILLLIVRLFWGGALVYTGFKKLLNPDNVIDLFSNLSIPFPHFSAYLVGTFELLGGISLVLGLFSRIFVIPLIIIFIVAYLTAHKEAIIDFNTDNFFKQSPFLFLYAALLVLCFGPGKFSFDYWLEKRAYGTPLDKI